MSLLQSVNKTSNVEARYSGTACSFPHIHYVEETISGEVPEWEGGGGE